MRERECEIKPKRINRFYKEVLRQVLPDGGLRQDFVYKGRKRFEPPHGDLSDIGLGH